MIDVSILDQVLLDSTPLFLSRKDELKRKIKKFFRRDKRYDIEEFFWLIKKGYGEISVEKANRYIEEIAKQIKNAKSLWQEELYQQLVDSLSSIKKEALVIGVLWINNFVYETDVDDLTKNWIKDRLVYRTDIKKYKKMIPDDCIKDIDRSIKSKLFDEIIILHTKKNQRRSSLDKSKKVANSWRRKVDPIAFGRMNWTDRLYPICDWVDDECDFTLKDIEDKVNTIVE